jgi:hypothetical protein
VRIFIREVRAWGKERKGKTECRATTTSTPDTVQGKFFMGKAEMKRLGFSWV